MPLSIVVENDFQAVGLDIPSEIVATDVELSFSTCAGQCYKVRALKIAAKKCASKYPLSNTLKKSALLFR